MTGTATTATSQAAAGATVDPRLANLALSERGFLFDPSTGHTFSLNPVGTFLLQHLIRGASPDELARLVVGEFETTLETAARDAEMFLLQLREMGLMAAAGEGGVMAEHERPQERAPLASPAPLVVAVTGVNATDNPGPGVPVARALREGAGDRPIRIVGLAYEPMDPGLYIPGVLDAGYLLPYPSQGAEAMMGRLRAIHELEGIDLIFPNLDSELPIFIKMEEELRAMGIACYLPTAEQLKLRSKARFNALAETCGIQVPRGRVVTDVAGLHALQAELPFPIMVKGQFYEAYMARTPFDAEALFNKIAAKWGLPVVVQEVIVGEEYDVVAVGDGEGGIVGAVGMRKLQLTDKGKAWGGVTVADEKLDRFVVDTMARLKWRGPCELEIMRSSVDDELYLLEVNPRFPAWCYLAVGAGQNQPWAVAQLALGEDPGELPPPRVGTMFLRHSWDLICSMEDYAALTTVGGFSRSGDMNAEEGGSHDQPT